MFICVENMQKNKQQYGNSLKNHLAPSVTKIKENVHHLILRTATQKYTFDMQIKGHRV